jgi:acetyl esterase/lipase
MPRSEATTLSFTPALRYATRAEGDLLLDVLAPPRADDAPSRPVVIFLHGGGWHEGDRGAALHPWLNPLLASRGFVTIAPTYRLSGSAPWPAQIDDVTDAVGWAREHAAEFGGDPERIGIWGFSAGAHLAALVALQKDSPLRAVALAAGPSDLRDSPTDAANEVTRLLGHPGTEVQLAELSPVCHVRATPPPMLIAHGTLDEVVPFPQALALRDALRAAGGDVEWHPIEGGSHAWADTPVAGLDESAENFGTLAAAFFERHL